MVQQASHEELLQDNERLRIDNEALRRNYDDLAAKFLLVNHKLELLLREK